MPKQRAGFASKSHLADMSLPPEKRGRKRKTSRGATKGVTAQLSHAKGKPSVNDQRRKWDKQTKQRRR
jgi:hypothetical protein